MLRKLAIILMTVIAAANVAAQSPSTCPDVADADTRGASDQREYADTKGNADTRGAADIEAPQLPKVSLLTVGQGPEIYHLDGHAALRFQYPNGQDITVNWGVFDFNSPNFVYRFVKGETDYSIGLVPMDLFVAECHAEGRELIEQPLNLTDAEVERMVALINDNLQPANREYRYNYVKDNCATRPLAIIERALMADSASLRIDAPGDSTTFRGEMRRNHSHYPTYQLGIDLVLGSGLDHPISAREQAFTPLYMQRMINESVIVAADGTERPVVNGTYTLIPGPQEPFKEGGVAPWIWIAAICAIVLIVTIIDLKRKKTSYWFDAIYYLIVGLIGLLLTFLIFVSSHEATSPNVNYLWANPLALLVPLLVMFKRGRRAVWYYQIVNIALLAAFIIGIPFFNQSVNILFIPLIVSDMIRSASYIYLNRK